MITGWPAAVAAGNVETSQRIADVITLALGKATDVPAQGQGTMNNVVIRSEGWTYYETMGGGQGASSVGDGPSGVRVGMSNTRNTPIEVFELEHPMRLRSYALRDGSGGSGRHRGGDGVIAGRDASWWGVGKGVGLRLQIDDLRFAICYAVENRLGGVAVFDRPLID